MYLYNNMSAWELLNRIINNRAKASNMFKNFFYSAKKGIRFDIRIALNKHQIFNISKIIF